MIDHRKFFHLAFGSLLLLSMGCQSIKARRAQSLSKQSPAQVLQGAELEDTTQISSMSDQERKEIEEFASQEVGIPDVPLMVNHKVERWIEYFQGRGSGSFARWLARSGRYIPMMQSILRENGLPDNLVYLSMIESGFTPHAYSRAAAVGPWQFVRRTGMRYGLKVNWWIDERRHPEKSTIAAAAYLKDLYEEFQHWYLAAAGYNAGEGKIARAISRYRTEDYWEISKYRYLKPETKNYVPKMLAAAMIASNPEHYGFTDIHYEEPISYDRVPVSKPIELKHIAKAIEVTVQDLRFLNPDLLRDVTPPKYDQYELHVPVGTGEILLAALGELPEYEYTDVMVHRVRSGEALSVIARKYGVSTYSIVSYNNLRSAHQIRAGQKLVIPIPNQGTTRSPQRVKKVYHSNAKGMYKVQYGDTLWDLAKSFGVTVTNLKQWNGITSPRDLRPGQWIRVKGDASQGLDASLQSDEPKRQYLVQKGDSLWDISRKHGITVASLAQINQISPKATLHPGTSLIVP